MIPGIMGSLSTSSCTVLEFSLRSKAGGDSHKYLLKAQMSSTYIEIRADSRHNSVSFRLLSIVSVSSIAQPQHQISSLVVRFENNSFVYSVMATSNQLPEIGDNLFYR